MTRAEMLSSTTMTPIIVEEDVPPAALTSMLMEPRVWSYLARTPWQVAMDAIKRRPG